MLQPGSELPSDLLKAVLKVLLGLAHDEISCEAIQQGSGIPRVIKLLEYAKDDQVRLLFILFVSLHAAFVRHIRCRNASSNLHPCSAANIFIGCQLRSCHFYWATSWVSWL